MDVEHNALPSGFHLEEYRIDSILGAGGFGITYKAWDTHLETYAAIKEYFPIEWSYRSPDGSRVLANTQGRGGGSGDGPSGEYAWGLERFLDEARVLARIQHPYVVRVRRFFSANGTAYIVMDYEDGHPLSAVLPDAEALAEEDIRGMLQDILPALQAVHSHGYLHLDLKPSNLFVRSRDNCVMLIDFGAAREALRTRACSRSVTTLVSPGYSSPEQYSSRGDHYGAWTDVYGLGAVLYRCITGAPPVEASARWLDDGLTPAAEAGAGQYSRELLTVVDRALAIRPEDRYQDAAELQRALEGTGGLTAEGNDELENAAPLPAAEVFEGIGVRPEAASVRGKLTSGAARRWFFGGGVATGLIAIIAAAGVLWWPIPSQYTGDSEFVEETVVGDDTGAGLVKPLAQAVDSEPAAVDQGPEQQGISLSEDLENAVMSEFTPGMVTESPPVAESVAGAEAHGVSLTAEEQGQIERLLTLATQSLAGYRLTTPEHDSALFYYREILRLDPGNAAAKQGMSEIATRYVSLVNREIRRSHYSQARRYIRLGLSVDPDHRELLALQRRADGWKSRRIDQRRSGQDSASDVSQRVLNSIGDFFSGGSSSGQNSQGFQNK